MSKRKPRNLGKYKTNPNIEKITSSNLRFTKDFKLRAIKLYQLGQLPMEIFASAGIDLEDFESEYARKSVLRWIAAADTYGLKRINEERRGLGSSGRPGSVKKFKTQAAELAYLRAENNFLKKLQALEKSYLKKKNTK